MAVRIDKRWDYCQLDALVRCVLLARSTTSSTSSTAGTSR